jgi:LysM repeat protein
MKGKDGHSDDLWRRFTGMKGKQDGEMGEFVEEMAESLIEMDEEKKGAETRQFQSSKRIYYLVFGAAILAGAAIAALGLLGGRNGPPGPELQGVLSRVQQLEERLSRAQNLEGRVASIEKDIKQMRQALGEAERFGLVLKQQLDKTIEDMRSSAPKSEAREQTLSKEAKETKGTEAPSVRGTITPDAPVKEEKPPITKAAPTAEEKKVALPEKQNASGPPLYHEVKKGENLYRISLKYGIPLAELCRLNNITPSTAIAPGMRLKVKP